MCYSTAMTRRRFSCCIVYLCTLLLIASCATSGRQTEPAVEYDVARDAVIAMLRLTSASAAVRVFAGDDSAHDAFIPVQAMGIVTLSDSVPGLTRLLDTYTTQMRLAVRAVATHIPDAVESRLSSATVNDPLSIIKNDPDGVTRYFVQQHDQWFRAWIAASLAGEAGFNALQAWQELLELYNTYVVSVNRIATATGALLFEPIEADPVETVTQAMIQEFILRMREQEELTRAIAASYDDPLIALFASY